MRIGIFTDSYLPRADGIAIGVEAYRAGLESFGHEVFIFCPKRSEPFVEPSARIYRFPSIPNIWYENYRDTFPFTPNHIKAITALRLDVIHTVTPAQIGALGMYIARRNTIPLVTTSMADFDLINEYKHLAFLAPLIVFGTSVTAQRLFPFAQLRLLFPFGKHKDSWLQRMIKVAAAFYNDQCDVVTTPSVKTKQAIQPYMKKPVMVMPLGINLSLVPIKPNSEKIRILYRLPEKSILFITTSRLVLEKRIDFIIKAFAQLSAADKRVSSLVVVGDGPLMSSLKKLVQRLGIRENVVFTGLLNNAQVVEIMSVCDVYVHASLRETQGLVLNEAAACGKPIIMIDKDINPVVTEGKNGLIAANTTADFSQKMYQMLHAKQLRIQYGIASNKLAKNFSQEKVAKQLVDLYQGLLAKTSKERKV